MPEVGVEQPQLRLCRHVAHGQLRPLSWEALVHDMFPGPYWPLAD